MKNTEVTVESHERKLCLKKMRSKFAGCTPLLFRRRGSRMSFHTYSYNNGISIILMWLQWLLNYKNY